MRYDVQGLTMEQLKDRVTPNKVAGKTDMRGVPKPLYDTQVYPIGGTAAPLTFFTNAAAAGRFLTNMDQAGQLPNPEFFVVEYIALDILGIAPGNVANLADVHSILFGLTPSVAGAPYALLRYNSQEWGPWPLSQMHATGGPVGFSTRAGVEYANPGVPGSGGIWIGGALTLQPLKAFSLNIEWAAAAPVTAALQLRVSMWGTHYYQIT